MNRRLFQAGRWHLGVYSPLAFSDLQSGQDVALYHPGWGTHPKHSQKLLELLAAQGIFPIALDTRYGYAEKGSLEPLHRGKFLLNALRQSRSVDKTNPYFPDASEKENRTSLRRPTATLALADTLGIDRFHLIGHSDGARTIATVAGQFPERVLSLTSVNGVGTDPAIPEGMSFQEFLQSIRDRNKERQARGPRTLDDRSPKKSPIERGYHLLHPRRSASEALVIGRADTWPVMSELAERGTPVNVIHGVDDPALAVERVAQRHQTEHPGIEFLPVEGGHNAIYRPEVAQQIADAIGRSRSTPGV